ncbi:MAG: hypothetical protein H6684_14110 [Deltaproteobacteria bacterium]|nr:hypothetical protein [bacterium]MCB9477019.1 hypothetical protein [Deltaproteobacteria bacterium]MCB9479641.1 hypothetical protein [Deltaproteobacteria bacterium]MCB9489862.1 hypothetical protein [Deltaproteobacteria bacterium]
MFESFQGIFDNAKKNAEQLGRALVVFEPEPPFQGRGLLTVLVTTASLITVAILGGVGLSCLVVLLLCLSLTLLILTRVLGIDFDVTPEEIFGFRP